MKTVGIIGLGVMGGSFAARMKELGYKTIGFDIDQDTINYATENQIIDQAGKQEDLKDCDLILFCLYPTKLKEWLKENQNQLKENTLILEIGGVKQPIQKEVKELKRQDIELLSIHPMCGRESRGIQHSDKTIFHKANFLIIPDEDTSPKAAVTAGVLAKELGCENISILTPEEHDKMIAFLSQLTHVLAVTLMNTHENGHLVEYTGDSFRDLTRIAKINEDMWTELFLLNKKELLNEMEQFETSFQQFKKLLETEDKEGMKEQFRLATARREKFDKY